MEAAGVDFYRLEIPAEGLLDLEVSSLGGAGAAEPAIVFLGEECSAARALRTRVASGTERHLIDIDRPGRYFLAVSGRERSLYRLQVAFAAGYRTGVVDLTEGAERVALLDPYKTGSDEWDEETDQPPTPPPPPPPPLPPLGGFATDPGGALGAKSTAGYRVRFRPQAVCPENDDHGETARCASELRLGSRLSASLEGGALDDRDAFTFVLDEKAAVVLETTGAVDTVGELFDAAGALVAADDDAGDGDNFRIEATLEAGRYVLRVAGYGGERGRYELSGRAASVLR